MCHSAVDISDRLLWQQRLSLLVLGGTAALLSASLRCMSGPTSDERSLMPLDCERSEQIEAACSRGTSAVVPGWVPGPAAASAEARLFGTG